MGEYADDEYRRSVRASHGFDPGSMYGDDDPPRKPKPPRLTYPCPQCGRRFAGLADHVRDVHEKAAK